MAYTHRVDHAEPVIHHTHEDTGDGGFSFLMGIVVLLFLLVVFFFYVLPFIQRGVSAPQVNIPGKIDVNVNQK